MNSTKRITKINNGKYETYINGFLKPNLIKNSVADFAI